MYIYRITHSRVAGSYIGKTTKLPRSRWEEHLGLLRNGVHDNDMLQAIAEKHGLKTLKFKVIDRPFFKTKKRLGRLELKWIARCGSWNERPSQDSAKRALKRALEKNKVHWTVNAFCAVVTAFIFFVFFW